MRIVQSVAVVTAVAVVGLHLRQDGARAPTQVQRGRPGPRLAACEKRGEIEVSVKDRLGPYERDELRVRDELETLARNEAPGLCADTIQPKVGARRWRAALRRLPLRRRQGWPSDRRRSAETVPLKD